MRKDRDNKYSVGGTILSGMIGAYIGYKYAEKKKKGRKLFSKGGGVKHSYEIEQEGDEFVVEFYKSDGKLDWGKGGFSSREEAEKYALENRTYAEGGKVAEYWKPIDESSIYRGVHDYYMDGIDDNETPLEGEVWIKFKSIPKGVTNLPYEVKRAIESDFEYYGYSNSEYPKSVSLNEGSWFDYYISFKNLTYQELEDLLIKLPEQVAESLEEQEIEGYGELGFYTYGNYIDAEISSDYESEEEDEYEYAEGGEVDGDVYFAVVTKKGDKNYNKIGYSKSSGFIEDKQGNEFDKLYFDNKKTPLKYNIKDISYLNELDNFTSTSGRKFILLKEITDDDRIYYYILHSDDKKVYAESYDMDAIKSELKRLTNGKNFYAKAGVRFAGGGTLDYKKYVITEHQYKDWEDNEVKYEFDSYEDANNKYWELVSDVKRYYKLTGEVETYLINLSGYVEGKDLEYIRHFTTDDYIADLEYDDDDYSDDYAKGGGISDVVVYDNGGESFDRYTIFTPDGSVYGMSDNALMPNGFNMYIGDDSEIQKGTHLGKKLKSVPKSIKIAVERRMNEEYAKGGEVSKPKRGLTYGKKDDVYFDVVTLLNSKMQKPKGIFGQEKPKVQTMSLDSLMEYLKYYEIRPQFEVDLPTELFTKESFLQYRTDDSKFRFISGKIYRLGKEELMKKLIDSYITENGRQPNANMLAKFERLESVKYAPEKTTIVQRIMSKQLLAKGGGIGFKGLSAKVAKRYEGKSVAPKYQSQYGTTYSKSEAKEVGDKVAGKVYWNQQGRKMAMGGGVDGKKYYMVFNLSEFKEKPMYNHIATSKQEVLDILLESYESIVGHKMYGNGYTIQDLNESDYNKYGVYINDDYAFVTANPRNFDTSNTISWQQKGRKMAQGGLTEHGLKVGDKIERKLDAEGSVIKVKNKRENAFVELDSGYRMPIYEFSSMAKGGSLDDFFNKFENDFSSTRRGGVKNYSVDIDLENGEQLRGGDLDFKDGNDALFLYERVKKVGKYQNEPIEDIQLIANFKNGDYESLYVPKFANGGGVDNEMIIAGVVHKEEPNVKYYELLRKGAKEIESSHPRGTIWVLGNKAYVSSGYSLYSFNKSDIPKIQKAYQSGNYANGGGISGIEDIIRG